MANNAHRYALLSLAAAIVTIALKTLAWRLTDSVGLLSDALEGLVNLFAAVVVFVTLIVAARPADETHTYGYTKVEYFASGLEGLMILFAAVGIASAAYERLLAPHPLQHAGIGLLVSLLATAINGLAARQLFKAGRAHRSVALEADARHLMTDVWTSVGIVVGVGAVALTGWNALDSLIAFAVALHILWSGFELLLDAYRGLLDSALPAAQRATLDALLASYRAQGIDFHAIRTRQAGRRAFISLHVLVPAEWTVARGHALLDKIEHDIRAALPGVSVITHLEPLNRPESYNDNDLD